MNLPQLKTFSGRRASQNSFELTSFVNLLLQHNVKTYLEVGARHGDTFHHVMEALGPGARGVAVDYPGALWGTTQSRKPLTHACADLKAKGIGALAIYGDSTDAAIVAEVLKHGPYDAIFIDGDHTYQGVRADWLNYSPMGKLVGFHDIVGADQAEKVSGQKVEVPRLWAEIKEDFKATIIKTHEFVAEGSKMGIGVCALR